MKKNRRKFKTFQAKASLLKQSWYLVDAKDQVLGRLASAVSGVLRGKNLVSYSPHVEMQNYIVIINAEKIRVTGDKLNQKIYHEHTLYPGGYRQVPLKDQLAKSPEKVLKLAIKRMLPKNNLSHTLMTNLKIYKSEEHPHQAQKPELVSFDSAVKGKQNV